ncbi:MAG: polynucleotide adenylyltransferase [Deltaproteobacteria bacterium]|nr:polynucleotide adenylyltransferase [Deltaproteobacteria bacterium]
MGTDSTIRPVSFHAWSMRALDPRFPLMTEVYRMGDAIRQAGGNPLLVGGWVRDCLLENPHSKDFDLEVFGLAPERLQPVLARFGPVHTVGRHFGVLKVTTPEAEYDVSVPRRESKIGKGHKHFKVEPDPTMTFEEAAARRDFTINAMGYDFLHGQLLDPHGGLADLEQGVLRHVGPSFGEDPLRVLRAMQFAARFGFTIPEETLAICREQDLAELPRERLWEEFRKMLLRAPVPSRGLAYADALGILPHFPELAALAAGGTGPQTPWGQTLAVVDRAAERRTQDPHQDIQLMLAALCHRMGPGMEEFLGRLTQEAALVKSVAALAADIHTPVRLYEHQDRTDPDIRRLALRVSIPFLLRLASALGQGPDNVGAGAWLEEQARRLEVWDGPPKPLLQGRHLLALGMKPGRAMGSLVEEMYQLQLDGQIATHKQAVAAAKEKLIGREEP